MKEAVGMFIVLLFLSFCCWWMWEGIFYIYNYLHWIS